MGQYLVRELPVMVCVGNLWNVLSPSPSFETRRARLQQSAKKVRSWNAGAAEQC
jgi:hypothetical protein